MKRKEYRVDNIPFYLRPLYLLLSYFLGNSMWLLCVFCNFTLRTRTHNLPPGCTDLYHYLNTRPFIMASWHRFVPVLTVLNVGARQRLPRLTAMGHPAWYMKPVHVLVEKVGFNLVMGSTGHGGRDASLHVIQALRNGHSTLIMTDGPKGPAQQMKPGAVHMSIQSGVPILPLCCRVSGNKWVDTKSWDRKVYPLPFAKVEVFCGKPVVADPGNAERVRDYVTACMNSPEACLTLQPPLPSSYSSCSSSSSSSSEVTQAETATTSNYELSLATAKL